MALKLKDGKFYDDAGNVVPLEHGNNEQIKILSLIELMREEGEEPNICMNERTGFLYSYYIACVACKKNVPFNYQRNMIGRSNTCECGLIYFIDDGSPWSEYVVKIK